jgi:hypothetical protein
MDRFIAKLRQKMPEKNEPGLRNLPADPAERLGRDTDIGSNIFHRYELQDVRLFIEELPVTLPGAMFQEAHSASGSCTFFS